MKIYKGHVEKLSGPRTWYLIVDDNIGYYWGPTGVYTRTHHEYTQEVVDDKCYQEIGLLEFLITHGMTKEKIKQAIEGYKRVEQVWGF